MSQLMKCIDNHDYVECLTVGKVYEVEIEDMGAAGSMKKLMDDNGEFLQTMLDRFCPA